MPQSAGYFDVSGEAGDVEGEVCDFVAGEGGVEAHFQEVLDFGGAHDGLGVTLDDGVDEREPCER